MTDDRTEIGSDENHGNETGFEHEDLGPRPIFGFLISLAILGVLVYYVIWGIFYFLDSFNRRHEQVRTALVAVQPNPREVRTSRILSFPEPRLEENERDELAGFRYGEEDKLNSYGWVDENAGIAHIPISQAIELVAQRGLSTSPKTGTMPVAPVNLARAAAEASDTSNQSKTAAPKGKKP